MNSPKLIFHVGLPKSASSTLQKVFFPFLDGIDNFGLYPTNNIAGSNELPIDISPIFLQDPNLLEFYRALHNKPQVTVEELKTLWTDLKQRHATGRSVLLSHEAMTSSFFSSISVFDKAERIKALFDDAKIVIVLREQCSWLQSQYTDHPFKPTSLSVESPCSFDEWVDIFLNHPKLKKSRESLNHLSLVNQYVRLFGKENVSVLRLEWLRACPQKFYGELAKVFECTPSQVEQLLGSKVENRGVPRIVNILRQRQRKLKRAKIQSPFIDKLLKVEALKRLPKANYKLSAAMKNQVIEYYKDSNEALEAWMLSNKV